MHPLRPARPYRKDRLIAERGADVRLTDLRHKLAVACPLVGHRATPCGVYYADLVVTS